MLFLKKRKRNDFVLALDVGSYKTCAVVARLSNNTCELINFSYCTSRGVKKGNLIDKEAVLTSVKTMIEDLAIEENTEVVLSIPSLYTSFFMRNFSIALKKKRFQMDMYQN